MSTKTEFYTAKAQDIVEGVSTADGQDVIDVYHDDNYVSLTVYTPRSDDPEQDEQNRSEPETRIYDYDEKVDLAVFEDTEVDLREEQNK